MNGKTPDVLVETAKDFLTQAIMMDDQKNYVAAVQKYVESATLLHEASKLYKPNDPLKNAVLNKASEAVTRAELLKSQYLKTVKKLEQIKVLEDSTGHDYYSVFGKCIDGQLQSVIVEDPYISSHHQILNFVRFCEVLAIHAKSLRHITLITGESADLGNFDELRRQLIDREITLIVSTKRNLHDREIRFSNGWIIKIGRGLDYFKPLRNKYMLGSGDYTLRPCRECNIDIFKVE
ncbi:hypothetical protein L596_017196 [Steinernema carpocapsae]|uniref:MIT domain-containing protein n=1 Tax=Steinernema carpocapsae TaxID=34508 RepID=A0A4U5N140_STECR|nr:hypothetical protein L596_017196 [Steinernema carpocapsae]